MKKELDKIKKEALELLEGVIDLSGLESVEKTFFGRKSGKLNLLLKGIKDLPAKAKKDVGSYAHEIKTDIIAQIERKKEELQDILIKAQLEDDWIDVTADVPTNVPAHISGGLNPNTRVQYLLEDIFSSMGFVVYDGPELGSDYFNFQAVNIPLNHPARDMQDTLYIKDHPSWLMRTHTSEAQVRAMLEMDLPLKLIIPGRVFRNEATDARHEHTFYQLEGMIVSEDINYSHLKYILNEVAKALFGSKTQTRFNPKFYPFVEPGFSGDVTCFLCDGKGCSVCKKSGWLEFFGAGVIHPNVLKAGKVDTAKYQGIAFGLGMSRMAMLRYNIDDARLIQSGDLRFLKQF